MENNNPKIDKELLKEFYAYTQSRLSGIDVCIEDFIKLKQQKDYEILSYTDKCILGKGNEIKSVKRLSDGEIFTIGDEIVFYGVLLPPANPKITIVSFNVIGNNLLLNCTEGIVRNIKCSELKKKKQPLLLFKTFDGVEIYDENLDVYGYLNKGSFEQKTVSAKWLHKKLQETGLGKMSDSWLFFSSEEARGQYILNNKKLLSLNDLLDVWDNNDEVIFKDSKEHYASSPMFNSFKEKAKQNLNKK